jgi:hypothetical protein
VLVHGGRGTELVVGKYVARCVTVAACVVQQCGEDRLCVGVVRSAEGVDD